MSRGLLKKIVVKVFSPGNGRPRQLVFRAGNGRHFTSTASDEILSKVSADVEKVWPGEEFAVREIGPAAFNIVHVGKAAAAGASR